MVIPNLWEWGMVGGFYFKMGLNKAPSKLAIIKTI